MWAYKRILSVVGYGILLVGRAGVAFADADCGRPPVEVARIFGPRHVEQAALKLSLCNDQPNLAALDELSILARPNGSERPTEIRPQSDEYVADGIIRLDRRLLTRLQTIADRFPGHRIAIVSGYRPNARQGSRHRHGEALDLRVEDVNKEDVVAFAQTIPGTGVGYYPNSIFTHVDVRTDSYAWVDKSGPGESPEYGTWPSTGAMVNAEESETVRSAREAMQALREVNGRTAEVAPTTAPTTVIATAATPEGAATVPTNDIDADASGVAMTAAELAEVQKNVRDMIRAEIAVATVPATAPAVIAEAPVAVEPPVAVETPVLVETPVVPEAPATVAASVVNEGDELIAAPVTASAPAVNPALVITPVPAPAPATAITSNEEASKDAIDWSVPWDDGSSF